MVQNCYAGKSEKIRGSKIDNSQNTVFGHNMLISRSQPRPSEWNRNSKACRFHWYKPFGCAPPKASFYEFNFFSQNVKVQKSKIEILVGISFFVEDSKSLLPTLGRSANLSEPWAPRKDTCRSFVHFDRNIVKHL